MIQSSRRHNMYRILKSLLTEHAWALPGYALLFLLMAYPLVGPLLHAKATLLAMVIAIVVALGFKTLRVGLHPSIIIWTLLLSALGLLFVMEGFLSSAPGAAKSIGVYVIWPVLYVIMIAGVRTMRTLRGLAMTAALSTIFISALSIFYMLMQVHLLPENKYYDALSFDWDANAFAMQDGYLFMQYPGINSLPFLVPFALAAFVTFSNQTYREVPVRRVWFCIALIGGLEAMLVSGRRALILVTLIAPVVTLLFLSFQPVNEKRVNRKSLLKTILILSVLTFVSLVCLNIAAGINLSGLYERFSVAFDFRTTTMDNGANERRDEFHALLVGWMQNPLLGAGHGAPAYGSVRSDLQPWSYELKYMALLYQTGILGFAAYAAGVCWIYRRGVQIIREGGYLSALMVACLTGTSCILIAHATNPYLDSFDGMWMLFFPLAVINLSLLQSHRARASACSRLTRTI